MSEPIRRGKLAERFARIPDRVWKDDQLSPTSRVVYAALSSLDFPNGASIKAIAVKIGRKRNAIERAIRQLEAAGCVEVVRASGRKNVYRLVEVTTTCENAPGTTCENAPGTTCENAPGTTCENAPGSRIPPNNGFEIKEREEISSPTSNRSKRKPDATPSLFADHERGAFRDEVAFRLRAVPDLAAWATWFPDAVGSLFRLNSWRRPEDAEVAADWAGVLQAIGATQQQVEAAIDNAKLNPPMRGDRKLFSRPDYLRHIRTHIEREAALMRERDRRASTEGKQTMEPQPKTEGQIWDEATREERDEATRRAAANDGHAPFAERFKQLMNLRGTRVYRPRPAARPNVEPDGKSLAAGAGAERDQSE